MTDNGPQYVCASMRWELPVTNSTTTSPASRRATLENCSAPRKSKIWQAVVGRDAWRNRLQISSLRRSCRHGQNDAARQERRLPLRQLKLLAPPSPSADPARIENDRPWKKSAP